MSDNNDLKTPSYKTNSWSEGKASSDLANLDKFLENEKNTNSIEPWSKLDKTAKLRKLLAFAENYAIAHELTKEEHDRLNIFFRDCLDRKKLYRVKDVNYDKDTGEIKEIPALIYNKHSVHFTLKNIDKRVSTLKGLTPKKKQCTIKNIKSSSQIDSSSESDPDTDEV
jgi:hypothetical protein